MKLYRRLGTVPGASIPTGYGILWHADWIKAACVDESKGREILWVGPSRYEVAIAVADAWAHSTELERDKRNACYPVGYDVVCHHIAADYRNREHDRYQAVFELDTLDAYPEQEGLCLRAGWTGELKETRPAAISDTWIHASGYKPEGILH